jgi:ATP-dependent DNA helicase RecQ
MDDYLSSETCLMELLGRALDDPTATACGRCGRCTGRPLTVELDRALVVAAQEFLRREPLSVDPRKRDARNKKIPDDVQLEPGRALAYWGDGGWGGLVRDQRAGGRFSDELVDAVVRLVREWKPQPRPAWVTCVPSTRDPDLVASFAARVAEGLQLPFHDAVTKVRSNAPQAEMANTAQQSRNVADAFAVTGSVPSGPVLLVDDTVDSRWTLTEIGGRLRAAGAGPVFPHALAQASGD